MSMFTLMSAAADEAILALAGGIALIVAATALDIAPAAAQTVLYGENPAAQCHSAVTNPHPGQAAVKLCNDALATPGLSATDRAATLVNRSLALKELGQIDQASADVTAALALAPDLSDAHIARGNLLQAQGQAAAAIAAYNQALAGHPTRPAAAYLNRAAAHETVGQVRLAYADLKEAARIEPNWVRPQEELSRFQVVRKMASN